MNRAKLLSYAKEIAGYSPETKEKLKAKNGLLKTIEGRELSLVNTMLILIQTENATEVGGYRQWQKLGRTVKKGESGAFIFFPCKKSDGSVFFKMVPMFDISQTEEIPVRA